MTKPRIWQMASGSEGHDFSQLCLDHDVMILGPGRYGPFDPKTYKAPIENGEFTKAKIGYVGHLHGRVQCGDYVVLRYGHLVRAIGLVASDYEFNSIFDDIDGWDLQHSRRVIWQDHLSGDLEQLQSKKGLFAHMRKMPSFCGIHDDRVLKPVKPLLSEMKGRELKSLPDKLPDPLTLDEIGQALFEKGISNNAVDKVILAMQRQRRLLQWYALHGKRIGRPSEHEVVAHMISAVVAGTWVVGTVVGSRMEQGGSGGIFRDAHST
jgi:hypothetical protein